MDVCLTAISEITTGRTAEQRIDPNRNSPFVWTVKSTDTYSETVLHMSYTNWQPGQPDYQSQEESYMVLCIQTSRRLYKKINLLT